MVTLNTVTLNFSTFVQVRLPPNVNHSWYDIWSENGSKFYISDNQDGINAILSRTSSMSGIASPDDANGKLLLYAKAYSEDTKIVGITNNIFAPTLESKIGWGAWGMWGN